MGRKLRQVLVGSVTLACLSGQVFAQDVNKDLAVALREVALRANVEVMFDPALVASRMAAPATQNPQVNVQGQLTALLTGTGLEAKQTGQGVFVVQPASPVATREAGSISGVLTAAESGGGLTGAVLLLIVAEK